MNDKHCQQNKLSSSLKERLKRCGRYHASPTHVTMDKQSTYKLYRFKISDSCQIRSPTSELECTKALVSKENSSLVCDGTEHDTCEKACDTETAKDSNDSRPSFCENWDKQVTGNLQDKRFENDVLKLNRTPTTSSVQTGNKDIKRSRLDFNSIDGERHSEKLVLHNSAAHLGEAESRTPGSKPLKLKDNRNSDRKGLEDPHLLEKELTKQEEILRKLKMVKMYRTKNNLEELQLLINKWREVSQQALQDLHSKMDQEPKPSLTELIDHLGISHELIHFNGDEDETFS